MTTTTPPTNHTMGTSILLWIGLTVGLIANGSLPFFGAPVWVSAPIGVLALACGIALIVRKVRANEKGSAR